MRCRETAHDPRDPHPPRGRPEVLQWDAIEGGKPGPGQVRLRQPACGLNCIDIYMREGVYPPGKLPAVLGMGAAGVIEAPGNGVTEFKKGERVAYPMVAGGYAQERIVDAERLVARAPRRKPGSPSRTVAAV